MRVLTVSVHPDDETIGCGGTLLKHKDSGDEVFWLIITGISTSEGYPADIVEERENQIRKVAELFGFKNVYRLDIPTTKLHLIDLNILIDRISSVVKDVRPEIIYMINRSDIHTDHQVAAKAIMSCTKAFRYPFIKKLLMYECLSETEMAPPLIENYFLPNVYSNISAYLDKKLDIMKVYKSEIQEVPLPRSLENIKALARYRGATCCLDYAEAFMLLREII